MIHERRNRQAGLLTLKSGPVRPCWGDGTPRGPVGAEHGGGEAQMTPQRLTARGRVPLPLTRKKTKF